VNRERRCVVARSPDARATELPGMRRPRALYSLLGRRDWLPVACAAATHRTVRRRMDTRRPLTACSNIAHLVHLWHSGAHAARQIQL
jgi:hypothetical protein